MLHTIRVLILNIFHGIVIISILLLNNVDGKDNTIQVLIHKPDIESTSYLEKYNTSIKQHLLSIIHANNSTLPELSNVDINFSYCHPEPTDGNIVNIPYDLFWNSSSHLPDELYARTINCTIRALKSSKYDLLILDNQFLFFG